MNYQITQPVTEDEFNHYFYLRWKLLRAPWSQAEGSEVDSLEEQCFHLMATDARNAVIAVARLQFNSDTEAQIRYMAVDEQHRCQGIARQLVTTLEQRANDQGYQRLILDAREAAVGFYEKLGYVVTGKSYLLFDEIQHYRMIKKLKKIKTDR